MREVENTTKENDLKTSQITTLRKPRSMVTQQIPNFANLINTKYTRFFNDK